MPAEIESINADRSPRQVSGPASQPWIAVLAGLALLFGVVAHFRLGQLARNDVRLRAQAAELRTEQERLALQAATLANRVTSGEVALQRELVALRDLPATIGEFGRNLDEVRARTETPQRAWIGAEAGYLLYLAQRRLELEHDFATAIAAMSAADARLATLGDPAIVEVRRELSREIAALRDVRPPDMVTLLERLDRLDTAVAVLPVKGVTASRPGDAGAPASASGQGATARIREAVHEMFSLRRVDPEQARRITVDEETLRRQQLHLLLLSVRVAALQRDEAAYLSALARTQARLVDDFDTEAPDVEAAQLELRELAGIRLDPPLPAGIGNAAHMLQRLTRTTPLPTRPDAQKNFR